MRKFFTFCMMVFPFLAFGQGLDNRAVISTTGFVNIVINGATGNFKNDAFPGSHIEVLSPGLNMYVQGNWYNNNTLNVFSNSGSTVRFEGATQIIGGTDTTAFDNVWINGAGVKYLAVDIGVTGTMSMFVGTVELDGHDINFVTTGQLSGENNSTYVFEDNIGGTGGFLKSVRTINAPVAMNIAGFGYVLTTGLNLGTTIVNRGHQPRTGLGNQSIFRWYNIVPTNTANPNATVLIQYLNHELNGQTEANLEMWYSTNSGALWSRQYATPDPPNNWAYSTTIDSLPGWWTLSDLINNPLPVELVSFTGLCSDQLGYRDLSWVTASEINNDYFTIERSFDAVQWEVIREIDGAGNSNQTIMYTWTDNSLIDKPVYYRLSQTDMDGASETFGTIVYLDCGSSDYTATLWPNYNDGNFYVKFADDVDVPVTIILSDNSGKIILQQSLVTTGSSQIVQFHEQLAPGIYHLRILGKHTYILKVCVK